VRIRSRKPWVFDRRRLFGWNVRLLTRYSHYTTSAVAHPPADGHARGGFSEAACAVPGAPEAGSCGGDPVRARTERRHRGALQTPPSIAEVRRPPAPGRERTPQPAPPAGARVRGTPQSGRYERPPTRPQLPVHRCRAVDTAVSVAVAPRRTSESRRVGRPRRPHRPSTPSSARQLPV
jgi:hypothetical protein